MVMIFMQGFNKLTEVFFQYLIIFAIPLSKPFGFEQVKFLWQCLVDDILSAVEVLNSMGGFLFSIFQLSLKPVILFSFQVSNDCWFIALYLYHTWKEETFNSSFLYSSFKFVVFHMFVGNRQIKLYCPSQPLLYHKVADCRLQYGRGVAAPLSCCYACLGGCGSAFIYHVGVRDSCCY